MQGGTRNTQRWISTFTVGLGLTALIAGGIDLSTEALAAKPHKPKAATGTMASAATAAQHYVNALAQGDMVAVGQLDFACQYAMASSPLKGSSTFPPPEHPIYKACYRIIAQANDRAVEHRGQALDLIWPGKDRLVFFEENPTTYPASAFVMELIGHTPPGSGLKTDVVETTSLPPGSFRVPRTERSVSAPTTLVKLRVSYHDPITAPVTLAPGAYQWTNTVKRPRQIMKSVVLKWVVFTGLKKHGFAGDVAVLNLPISDPSDRYSGFREAIPFTTETSGLVVNSIEGWNPEELSGLLLATVARAAVYPQLIDRVSLLNRVLLLDPLHPDALSVIARDLYQSVIEEGKVKHQQPFADSTIGRRYTELFWNTYAQTDRMDLSLGMEMGGLAAPTPADALYRMIPAMNTLATVRPEDLENRFRLANAYRWNNDQLAAIATSEALLKAIPENRTAQRARALTELAWSRIAKVAWGRRLNDLLIPQAYQEAQEAFGLAEEPLGKFSAAYIMAYSQAFNPARDNQLIFSHLSDARTQFLQLPGATPQSWLYLLNNDTLKGVVESDPVFAPLLEIPKKAA